MNASAVPDAVAHGLNPFWARACGSRELSPPHAVQAGDLASAARQAFTDTTGRYAFRRPRELVDLDGRFRHFTYAGRPYVAKRARRASARSEADNAAQATAALAGSPDLIPIVPILVDDTRPDHQLLVTPDAGPTLAHRPAELARIMPWEQFVGTLRRLFDAGIAWPGFLPRNLIATRDHDLVMIDWEKCQFQDRGDRTVGDLCLLFWAIGWAGHYGLTAAQLQDRLRGELDLTVVADPLDDFEHAYASLVRPGIDPADVRRRCSEATIATESTDLAIHARTSTELPLGPAEVGHLLNELLPPHLSVLYTFASQGYLDSHGPGRYLTFIRVVNDVLAAGVPCHGLEGSPEQRRRLQLLILLTITAVLLDDADLHRATRLSTPHEVVERMGELSDLAAALVPITSPDGVSTGPECHPAPKAIDRLLARASDVLGPMVGPGPTRSQHAKTRPSSHEGVDLTDRPPANDMQALRQEILQLIAPAKP